MANRRHSLQPSSHENIKSNTPRPRRRRQRAECLSCPSAGILSLLATIAASSCGVNGSPITPPPFLCPSFECDEPTLSSAFRPLDALDSLDMFVGSSSQPSHPRKSRKRRRGQVPIRYEKGSDGRWRRVSDYTLYGSTVCLDCVTTPTPTATPKGVDDQTAVTSSVTTNQTSATVDILDSLPSGWKPSDKNGTRTTVILAMSLVLAFLICFLMVGCVFWRRNKRRGLMEKDIEMKARKRATEEQEVDKKIRVKKRVWARATARWKANARYIARQRRGKRTGGRPQAQSSSVSLRQSGVASGDSSVQSSRRPSISEVPPELPPPLENHDSPSRPPTPSPPAYRIARIPVPGPSLPPDTPPPLHPTHTTSHHTYRESKSRAPSEEDEEDVEDSVPYTASAHVATDDKRLLERLADLASAPPSLDVGPSARVPVWHDEDADDFLEPPPLDPGGSSYIFPLPPPPASEKMAAYQYAYDIEDPMEDAGPSAPPFEAAYPSAPSLPEELGLEPSAPPLLDEYLASAPSAPELDMENSESGSTPTFTPPFSRRFSFSGSVRTPPRYCA